jgi:hypothetical protein
MSKQHGDIRNKGRPWSKDEAWERFELLPQKNEMISGQLTWSQEERESVLALLLELVGADKAVRFGKPEVWRAAVAKLPS